MIRLFLLGLFLAAADRVWSAETDNALVLALPATAQHPRNSEGSFATLASGRIIYCYSQFSGGDSDFSPCRIVQIESDDEGRTWSQPRVLFTPEPKSMEMSVSLLRLASGRLACFTVIKHGMLDCRPYLRISSDDGDSWSAPRPILNAPGYFVLNNDRVIQTKTGRLIAPLAWHRGLKSADDGTVGVDLRAIDLWYYSDDEGATWTEAKSWWSMPVASQTGLQEPGAVELSDGTLFSWARTDQGCQYGFRSRDNGETWSAPAPLSLRSPAAPASIVRLPHSSDLLAVYVDYSGQFPFVLKPETYGGRTPLAAAVSSDGGVTWRVRQLLEDDPERSYSYPAIHFTAKFALFAYLAASSNLAKPGLMCIRRVSLARLTAPEDASVGRARAVLREVMNREEGWIKIHAAEALVAGGEAVTIRDRFLALVPAVDPLAYRVGVWRVLANTSPTLPERNACVAQVEKIFLNPAAPDRSQALETLCKLRYRVTGRTLGLVRAMAADPHAPQRPLALWSLRLAQEPGALESLCGLLHSPEAGERLAAAYAFRVLRENDPLALAALARAADREPAQSRAYPYLVSAAFSLHADQDRRAAWRSALDNVLVTGSDAARFEACQGLLADAALSDRPRFVSLLEAPGNDTRVGAALTLLHLALWP